jgi:16S rRNA processing protein RimM
MNQYFSIGKLVATFGLKGELILSHSLGKSSGFRSLEVIFLENPKDSFLPYFLREVRVKNSEEVYLSLEGIDTKEQARPLAQKEVWLQEADFTRLAGKSRPISLLGFHMINEGEDLGEVVEVIEQPLQVLCKVILQGKEVLIPLHEGTLEKVDQANKRVYVILPDGLLDVYLE